MHHTCTINFPDWDYKNFCITQTEHKKNIFLQNDARTCVGSLHTCMDLFPIWVLTYTKINKINGNYA